MRLLIYRYVSGRLVCPSPIRVWTSKAAKWISIKLILGNFNNICRHTPILVKIEESDDERRYKKERK
jgi:hypothetical protein